MNKHWRDVRSKAGNKLLFRYCAESDEVQIKAGERLEVVSLDELRPAHQRRFAQPVDETKHLCYNQSQYTVEASAQQAQI